MVEGFKSVVLHCYFDNCEKSSKACYVSRILFGAGNSCIFSKTKSNGVAYGQPMEHWTTNCHERVTTNPWWGELKRE